MENREEKKNECASIKIYEMLLRDKKKSRAQTIEGVFIIFFC